MDWVWQAVLDLSGITNDYNCREHTMIVLTLFDLPILTVFRGRCYVA